MTVRDRQVHIEGLEALRKMSDQVAPKVARRLARATVHSIAGEVRNAMRQRAPKDDGTLRKAIKSKRRRGRPDEAVSDVRIEHGRTVKNNAWYWHFIEFGTTKHTAQPFIQPTVDEYAPRIPTIYREEFGRRLEKELAKAHRQQK